MSDTNRSAAQMEANKRWPITPALTINDEEYYKWKQEDFIAGANWQKEQDKEETETALWIGYNKGTAFRKEEDAAYIKQLEEALFGLTSWAHRRYSQMNLSVYPSPPPPDHPITKADIALKKYKGEL
jgi:hypothetical protein